MGNDIEEHKHKSINKRREVLDEMGANDQEDIKTTPIVIGFVIWTIAILLIFKFFGS